MKVKLCNKISKAGLLRLASKEYAYSEDFDEYDALIVRSAKLHDVEFPADVKCIARAGAGVNNIPLDKCTKAGIVVFNTPGANANAVKELVIAAMLMSSRTLVKGIAWVASLQKDPDLSKKIEKGKSNFVGPEITGKKLGIIGLGAVGVKIANAAIAMGMDVYGYDPYVSLKAAWKLDANVHYTKELKDIFTKCDYISVHVPYNEETKNIIDAEAIQSMKPGVRVMNFARNGLIDDEAMIQALQDGKIGGYVSDFPTEELLSYDAFIGLPHLGASTPESEDNCACMAVDEIVDYLECGNITNSVNLPDASMPWGASYRICIINKNIPDMLGIITTQLAQAGVNIENMLNKGRGEVAYTLLETNNEVQEELLKKLQAEEGIIKVRRFIAPK